MTRTTLLDHLRSLPTASREAEWLVLHDRDKERHHRVCEAPVMSGLIVR